MLNKHRSETLTYLVLWTILFTAPVLSLYISCVQDDHFTFRWSEIFIVWRPMALFLAIFLLHNHLLAPILVYRQKRVTYFSFIILLVALFTVYQCSHRPKEELSGNGPWTTDIERIHDRSGNTRPAPPNARFDGERGMPPDDEMAPPPDKRIHDARPTPPNEQGHRPPLFVGQHDLIADIMLILMLGMNLGVKLYFKQRQDQLRLAQTQKRQLEQQLEYLKYQLNPHFLMNTLNNIHALVDISPAEAQEAIITLSRLLRYVLYESNKDRVPMQQEVAFMENYVRLMKIRYTDNLSFSVTQLADYSGILVPPLLFISFVENAFKHGVSYVEKSFIEITNEHYHTTKKQDRLRWTCRNSKHSKSSDEATKTPTTPDTRQGVGMKNVRQRLNLLYGKDYTLDVRETDDTFEVMLDIPLET